MITVLTAEELSHIRSYIAEASTPIQLQDSAVILLGTEMGIRGCDIVRLALPDVAACETIYRLKERGITVPLVARLLYRLNEYSVCIIHLVSARSFKFVSSAAAAGEY